MSKKKVEKKGIPKALIATILIVLVIGLAIILIVNKKSNEKAIMRDYYEDFVKVINPSLSELNLSYEIRDDWIHFENERFELFFIFDDKEISSISIDYNLADNKLNGEDTVKEIQKLYTAVTSVFPSISSYFTDDFLIKDEYVINDYDKNYIIDLLDYKAEYSSWYMSHRFREDGKYTTIYYDLSTKYDNEGFAKFSIDIF